MKRVLFDENMPRRLRRELPEFHVRTVQEEGWGSLQNGELLGRAEQSFDVLVTADRRMQFQQNLVSYRLAVVVIVAPRLRLELLRSVIEEIRTAIDQTKPGEVTQIRV